MADWNQPPHHPGPQAGQGPPPQGPPPQGPPPQGGPPHQPPGPFGAPPQAPGGWQPPGPAPPSGRAGGRKSKAGLFIALGAGVVVLALAGAGAFFVIRNSGPEFELRGQAEAAGMNRSRMTPGDSPVYTSIASAVNKGDADLKSSITAVYDDALHGGTVLFFGGTGGVGDPQEYLDKAKPLTVGHTTPINSSGDHTREICGTYSLVSKKMQYCAWVTSSTFGFAAPATPVSPPNDDDYDDLKATMVHMRSDIQFRAD